MSGRGEVEAAGRTAEGRIEIDAPAERVWRALTEAAELERWFPLEAKVEAGEGGRIWMSWGNEFGEWSEIQAWDPPRYLRTSWAFGGGAVQVTEYRLEEEGGRTAVRVVTSGFPEDASWDDMVEGTRLGWLFELHQLKHYVERHGGEDRRAAYIRRRVSLPRPEAWERLMAGIDESAVAAEVFDRSPPWQLAGIVKQPADGLIRLTIDPSHDEPDRRDVTVWLCGWGESAGALEEVASRWRAELAGLFPEGKSLEAGA